MRDDSVGPGGQARGQREAEEAGWRDRLGVDAPVEDPPPSGMHQTVDLRRRDAQIQGVLAGDHTVLVGEAPSERALLVTSHTLMIFHATNGGKW